VIGLLLRLYPGRWRERYGDELKDLVTETGLGAAAAADIARAAARERQRSAELALAGGVTMTIGPAWRHPTGWAAFATVVLAPTAIFVFGSLLVYQLGLSAFDSAMESASSWLQAQPRFVDLLLVLAPLAAACVALVPLVRVELRTVESGRRELGMTLRLRWINLLVAAIGLAVGALLVWHIVWESVLQVGG
jgi:hypothetical protein